jgi:hypothetical protein
MHTLHREDDEGKNYKNREKSLDIFPLLHKNLTNRFAHSRVDEKRAEAATLDIFTILQLTIRSHSEIWNKETSQI